MQDMLRAQGSVLKIISCPIKKELRPKYHPCFHSSEGGHVNNLTPKGGGFIPNPLGLRSMAGLQLPRQSQRTGSKLQKFYTFDAEDFMQRTIILCNLLFSIGKVLKAVVSKKNGVPYRNYKRGLN
jgi:hypothetical protein